MILALAFWIILLLCFIGQFTTAPPWPRISSAATLVLFVLIGLRIFRLDL